MNVVFLQNGRQVAFVAIGVVTATTATAAATTSSAKVVMVWHWRWRRSLKGMILWIPLLVLVRGSIGVELPGRRSIFVPGIAAAVVAAAAATTTAATTTTTRVSLILWLTPMMVMPPTVPTGTVLSLFLLHAERMSDNSLDPGCGCTQMWMRMRMRCVMGMVMTPQVAWIGIAGMWWVGRITSPSPVVSSMIMAAGSFSVVWLLRMVRLLGRWSVGGLCKLLLWLLLWVVHAVVVSVGIHRGTPLDVLGVVVITWR
mmetsp:Transcript_24011/g.56628  ORF Transcript_24011/g.56628 Transcript_24011/m.56628 type:complete len:256 (-) Transcript_24011:217-984(-)